MTNNNQTETISGTPYDDVYRTLVTDCPSLIIPVVNELFNQNLHEDTKITTQENEIFLYRQDGNLTERITDSHLIIDLKHYHIECQSTVDNTLLVRFFEYDSQIALKDSKLKNNVLTVHFPNTAVLYLRHNQNTPDKMTIQIKAPNHAECSYSIPVMKVSTYSIDEIFEKNLYFLIPFHIFTYERLFPEYESDSDKLQELMKIYEDIVNRLNQCANQGLITEYIKRTIIDMSKQVLKNISRKYSSIKEGIGEIMGGKVLEYEAKDILKRGIAQGHAQGLSQGLTEKTVSLISKKLAKNQTLEQIADALEESVETIEKLIEEYHLA